jgi:hypothetical protein
VEKEGKKFHMCTSSFFTTIAAVLRWANEQRNFL